MRRRALLALAHGAQSVALAATFTGALVAAVLVHANMPAVRRVAADVGNRVTTPLFEGKIVIGDVQSLSLGPKTTIRVREAEVLDPEGHRVIRANDVEATIDLERLLSSVMKHGTPDVDLDEVRVGSAEVVLDVDAVRAPRIARAFRTPAERAFAETPTPSSSSSTSPSSPPAREPRVHIRKARVGKAHVHGDLVPPELDGDATTLEARFILEDKRATATLDGGHLVLRSPKAPNQRAPLTGTLSGALAIDLETTELDGSAELDGSCGSIPVVARAKISGETVFPRERGGLRRRDRDGRVRQDHRRGHPLGRRGTARQVPHHDDRRRRCLADRPGRDDRGPLRRDAGHGNRSCA